MGRRLSGSRVKVSTEKLLKAVKARRASEQKRYERDLEQYDGKRQAYCQKVAEALRKAADAAEKGKVPNDGYRGVTVPVRVQAPSKPRLDIAGFDRLIQTLEMAADPTITISADDAAEYLG